MADTYCPECGGFGNRRIVGDDDRRICADCGTCGNTGRVPCANPPPSYADLKAEVAQLRRERDDFHMDYRMKCDVTTKALHVEVAALREAKAKLEDNLAAANKRIEELEIEMRMSNDWLDAALARIDTVIAESRQRERDQ